MPSRSTGDRAREDLGGLHRAAAPIRSARSPLVVPGFDTISSVEHSAPLDRFGDQPKYQGISGSIQRVCRVPSGFLQGMHRHVFLGTHSRPPHDRTGDCLAASRSVPTGWQPLVVNGCGGWI